MVKKYQLKNGLEVVLVPSKKSPVVSVQMWVNTGSADERKGEEGISHFIEHLVFKGSKEYKTGEIAQVVEASGGELNAYTSFDQTVFYVTVSSAFQKLGFRVIREMMGFPQFDADEIDNEREVVIEEIKRSNDSSSRAASRALFETSYKKHAYGIPVIGFEKNIKTVSKKKLVAYYKDRYSPANMKLIVTGDFDNKEIKKAIKEEFEVIPKTKVRKTIRKVEPPQKTPRYAFVKTKFEDSYLYISWPSCKATDKDAILLDLMALVIGQGESSHLVRRLRNELGLVRSVGMSCYTPKDKGLLAISMNMNPEKLPEIFSETIEVLCDFLVNPIDKSELIKAARSIESERYYSLETVDGMSALVGNYEFYFNDFKALDKVMKTIDEAKASDLTRLARKYFDPAKVSVIMTSKSANKKTEAVAKDFVKSYKQRFAQVKKQKISATKKVSRTKIKWSLKQIGSGPAKPAKHNLPGGARLVVLPNQSSPVVSLKAAFLGGQRAEVEKNKGVNEMLSRLWTAGTKNLSERELHEKIESSASYISSFGGKNSAGLSLSTLSAFKDVSFELFKDIWSEASFLPITLDREKVFMLDQLKSRDDNSSRVCILKMMEELFGRHPYHRDPLGTKDSVNALKQEDILAHLGRIRSSKNLVFSLVGDVEVDEWVEKLSSLVKQTEFEEAAWPKIESWKLNDSRHVYVEQDKEQSHICLAFPGFNLYQKERLALDVMQSVLAGQGGRLFLELRDKASLAYTVSPMRMDGIDGGYFGFYIGCSPEKGQKALGMMWDEIKKLQDIKVSDQELQRAKSYVIGRHDIGLQRNSSIANEMMLNELYKLPFDEYLHYSQQVSLVSAEEIQSLAKTLFAQNSVLSVVGKKDLKPVS